MKKLALLIVGLLFLNMGFSQKQQVKLKNPVVYEIESKSDSLVFSLSRMELEVAGWEFDSCNFHENSFEFQFEIKNATKQTIICNKTLDCWNDCGLVYSGRLNGEPLNIQSGKSEKITVRVMPYSKRKMSTSSDFVIIQNESQLLIPIHLVFACTSIKKCEKPIPDIQITH